MKQELAKKRGSPKKTRVFVEEESFLITVGVKKRSGVLYKTYSREE